MSGKLAVKHKNSLALKENKLLQKATQSKSYKEKFKPFKLILFPVITCCMFLIYWFVFCPLLFHALYIHSKTTNTKHWPSGWPILYWLIALVIWLLIMTTLLLIWKCLKTKYKIDTISKTYGSDNVTQAAYLTHVKHAHMDEIKLNDVRAESNTSSEVINDNESKKQKNLPPLVIHRRMSGNDIENPGNINIEDNPTENHNNDSANQLQERSCSNINRDSIKDYLKLVTVTPLEDETDVVKSVKSPLSPRELFFIDLIREAEKAENNKEDVKSKPSERKHFFPNDFTAPENPIKTIKTPGNESDDNRTNKNTESEPSYFIASVEKPVNEKTEVFLEINPDIEIMKEWSVDLQKENPILALQENNTEEGKNLKEGVVIFEI